MDDCIFCKIADKKVPSKIIYEDDLIYAFEDISPQAPIHVLVIPKKHINSISEVKTNNEANLIGGIYLIINKIAEQKGLIGSGYRVVVNHGNDGGQAVKHLHFHLLGGRKLTWPPG